MRNLGYRIYRYLKMSKRRIGLVKFMFWAVTGACLLLGFAGNYLYDEFFTRTEYTSAKVLEVERQYKQNGGYGSWGARYKYTEAFITLKNYDDIVRDHQKLNGWIDEGNTITVEWDGAHPSTIRHADAFTDNVVALIFIILGLGLLFFPFEYLIHHKAYQAEFANSFKNN